MINILYMHDDDAEENGVESGYYFEIYDKKNKFVDEMYGFETEQEAIEKAREICKSKNIEGLKVYLD